MKNKKLNFKGFDLNLFNSQFSMLNQKRIKDLSYNGFDLIY